MKITIHDAKSKFDTKKPKVMPWKREPGCLTYALEAAFKYARDQGKRMIVIPGNSYMSRVYHIAPETEDLVKFTAIRAKTPVAVVDPDGQTWVATAE